MRGQQTCPLGRQHTKAPLAAALSPWAYCTHPTHDVNDVMYEGWPQHQGLCPLLFLWWWCGFFYVPQEPDKCKSCETRPTVFPPYPRRLESLTVCRCHYKGSTFFSVILRPWVLVQLGFEPVNSRSADRRSPNWANQDHIYVDWDMLANILTVCCPVILNNIE